MFECNYKFELEDCLQCSKYIYKSSRRKKDKVITAMLPILVIAVIALLIVDIVKDNSIVLDIILLIAVIVLFVMNIIMPITLLSTQKKSFKKQKLDEMDSFYVSIKDDLCMESFKKDEKDLAKNVHSMKSLTSYMEDATRLILIFNKLEFACLRKSEITGGTLDSLKDLLDKALIKNSNPNMKGIKGKR